MIDLESMSEYLMTPDHGVPVTAGFAAFRDGMARGEGNRAEAQARDRSRGEGPAEAEETP